jgi:hypothetical protein
MRDSWKGGRKRKYPRPAGGTGSAEHFTIPGRVTAIGGRTVEARSDGAAASRDTGSLFTVETPAMHTSFDQTLPQPSRWDQQGAEYVRSNIDWCARCSKRLVGLNPGLTAEHAFDLAHDLSQDDNLRAMSPETVAEDMHQVDLRIDR